MIKIMTSLAAIAAATGLANSQPLPAPPMEKYTPAAEASCESQTLQIYFSTGESALNNASQAMLEAAQADLEGCIVGPISLEANASDAPSLSAAEHLAQARLDTVAKALQAHDISGTRLNASYDPAETASTLPNPMTRTVEVRLSAWAPQIG